MSPELQASFVAQWPDLSRRLNALFARKNVRQPTRDDLVQETALRLLRIWDSVDQSRSPWPLTATIGLNLLRDRAKALATTEVLADLPDSPAMMDVEDAGIARIELERVRKAMAELTHAQRTILLDEVGEASAMPGTAAAQKMLRMRARRKLRAILEHVSGIAVLRHSRLSEWAGTMFASRDAIANSAAACMACALIGTAVIAVNAPITAEAQPTKSTRIAGGVVGGTNSIDHGLVKILKSGRAERDGELVFADSNKNRARRSEKTSRLRAGDPTGSNGLPLPSNPGDAPVPMPPTPTVPVGDPPSAGDGNQPLPLPLPQAHDGAIPLPQYVLRIHQR
jgi:DNA-directed RNA polymerase specialized sigma24 family protein